MVNSSKDGMLLKFERWSRIVISFDGLVFSNVTGDIPVCSPELTFNPIQDGLFRGCHGWGRGNKAPLPKICHTYPTMMKLCTVIPYPKKIKKICESRDTPLEFF